MQAEQAHRRMPAALQGNLKDSTHTRIPAGGAGAACCVTGPGAALPSACANHAPVSGAKLVRAAHACALRETVQARFM